MVEPMTRHRSDERATRTHDDEERAQVRGDAWWLLRFCLVFLLCGFAVEALVIWVVSR
jgi:hypothetical protein